jgi:hypothetical protein
MGISNDPVNATLNDLQYLVDELEALKYLIDVVPVYERPGDELSVCEHVRLIQFTQESLLKNLDRMAYSFPDFESLVRDYKRQRSDIQSEQKKGVQHYINKLIQARAGLLNDIAIDKFSINDTSIEYLSHMIKIERYIFKEMAEKVLAINKDS